LLISGEFDRSEDSIGTPENGECDQSARRDSNQSNVSIGGRRCSLVHVHVHAVGSERRGGSERHSLDVDGWVGRRTHQLAASSRRHLRTVSSAHDEARRQRKPSHAHRSRTQHCFSVVYVSSKVK